MIGEKPHVIYMSPKGTPFSQKRAGELKALANIFILCGHYEGVDQRVLDEIVDEEISIGDYVLTGGELGALVVAMQSEGFVRAYCPRKFALPKKVTTMDCWNIRSILVLRSGMIEKYRRC